MLLGHSASSGSELENGKARGIVDKQGGFSHFRRCLSDPGKISLSKKTIANGSQIDPGSGAEHAQDERLGGHFQTEDTHGFVLNQRHMLGDIHGKRCFAHTGSGGYHNHFASMQAVRHLV